MYYEYLIFNIIVLTGPFFLGMLKPFYFIDRWKDAIISIVVVGVPFIIWDALVTGAHWMFNEKYITGIKLFNLPIEEWLFFVTVPFACLFTWEMISRRTSPDQIERINRLRQVLLLLPVPGAILYFAGLEYTGLVLVFLTIAIITDQWLETNLFLQKRFWWYMAMIVGFILLFNGFLTGRPVVTYGESFQLGFRVITIPIEDFGYGISLLYLNTVVYEKLKSMNQGKVRAT